MLNLFRVVVLIAHTSQLLFTLSRSSPTGYEQFKAMVGSKICANRMIKASVPSWDRGTTTGHASGSRTLGCTTVDSKTQLRQANLKALVANMNSSPDSPKGALTAARLALQHPVPVCSPLGESSAIVGRGDKRCVTRQIPRSKQP